MYKGFVFRVWVASIAKFRKMGGDGASESGLECCGFRASELWHSELRFRLQAHGLLPGPETRLLDKASSATATRAHNAAKENLGLIRLNHTISRTMTALRPKPELPSKRQAHPLSSQPRKP